MRTFFGTCLLLVSLAGCGQISPAAPDTAIATAQPPMSVATATSAYPSIVEQARQLLAAHLGVGASALAVQQVQAVQWSDGSLGCPQAGMMYPQVVTPGYRLTFSASGVTYDVHTGETKELVIMCENNQPTPLSGGATQEPTVPAGNATSQPATPTSAAHVGQSAAQLPTAQLPVGQTGNAAVPANAQALVEQARTMLAQEAHVATDAIHILNVEEVEWRNSSLGCPQPGMMYTQAITSGFRITLEANGTRYTYHTSMKHVIRCNQPSLGSGSGTVTK